MKENSGADREHYRLAGGLSSVDRLNRETSLVIKVSPAVLRWFPRRDMSVATGSNMKLRPPRRRRILPSQELIADSLVSNPSKRAKDMIDIQSAVNDTHHGQQAIANHWTSV